MHALVFRARGAGAHKALNLALTISVVTPLTIGTPLGGPCRFLRGCRSGAPGRRRSSLTVVCFGSSRGEADGGDWARLWCAAVALGAPPMRARHRRHCRLRVRARADDRHGADTGAAFRHCRRAAAALARRQAGYAAALSSSGRPGATAGNPVAAAGEVHRTDAHRRDADLRQSDRLRRRQYRLRFQRQTATQEAGESASGRNLARAAAGDDIRAGADIHVPARAGRGEKTAGETAARRNPSAQSR